MMELKKKAAADKKKNPRNALRASTATAHATGTATATNIATATTTATLT